jgi:hypothetical protein
MRLALGILVAIGGAAHADGVYVSDQLGVSTFHGSEARAMFGEHAADLRVALGLRARAFAFEAWMGGDLPIDDTVREKNGLPGYGVDAKYAVPLARFGGDADGVFAAYGKLDLRAVWLGDPSEDAGGGRGAGLGAGVMISGTLWARRGPFAPLGVRMGAWIERSADWLRVEPSARAMPQSTAPAMSGAFDLRVDHWTFGFGFGGDV